jgi:hypothetical protein
MLTEGDWLPIECTDCGRFWVIARLLKTPRLLIKCGCGVREVVIIDDGPTDADEGMR